MTVKTETKAEKVLTDVDLWRSMTDMIEQVRARAKLCTDPRSESDDSCCLTVGALRLLSASAFEYVYKGASDLSVPSNSASLHSPALRLSFSFSFLSLSLLICIRLTL